MVSTNSADSRTTHLVDGVFAVALVVVLVAEDGRGRLGRRPRALAAGLAVEDVGRGRGHLGRLATNLLVLLDLGLAVVVLPVVAGA